MTEELEEINEDDETSVCPMISGWHRRCLLAYTRRLLERCVHVKPYVEPSQSVTRYQQGGNVTVDVPLGVLVKPQTMGKTGGWYCGLLNLLYEAHWEVDDSLYGSHDRILVEKIDWNPGSKTSTSANGNMCSFGTERTQSTVQGFDGVPVRLVGTWSSLSKLQNEMSEEMTCDSLKDVREDVTRTCPGVEEFSAHGRSGCDALRRMLEISAIVEPGIGYVQGMNFIGLSILWHVLGARGKKIHAHMSDNNVVEEGAFHISTEQLDDESHALLIFLFIMHVRRWRNLYRQGFKSLRSIQKWWYYCMAANFSTRFRRRVKVRQIIRWMGSDVSMDLFTSAFILTMGAYNTPMSSQVLILNDVIEAAPGTAHYIIFKILTLRFSNIVEDLMALKLSDVPPSWSTMSSVTEEEESVVAPLGRWWNIITSLIEPRSLQRKNSGVEDFVSLWKFRIRTEATVEYRELLFIPKKKGWSSYLKMSFGDDEQIGLRNLREVRKAILIPNKNVRLGISQYLDRLQSVPSPPCLSTVRGSGIYIEEEFNDDIDKFSWGKSIFINENSLWSKFCMTQFWMTTILNARDNFYMNFDDFNIWRNEESSKMKMKINTEETKRVEMKTTNDEDLVKSWSSSSSEVIMTPRLDICSTCHDPRLPVDQNDEVYASWRVLHATKIVRMLREGLDIVREYHLREHRNQTGDNLINEFEARLRYLR